MATDKCRFGNPDFVGNYKEFGDYRAKQIKNGQYGVITDCAAKFKEACPSGYKYIGFKHWSFDTNRASFPVCGIAWEQRALCQRDFPSDTNKAIKRNCCLNKYNESEQKANCNPSLCKGSNACDQLMTEYCTDAANKSKVECACFQDGMTIEGPSGPIVFAAHCYATPENQCQDPQAYKTHTMETQDCPPLVLCDITGNKINVTGGDVKIGQQCQFKRDPKTGKFMPSGKPGEIPAPGETPTDTTTPLGVGTTPAAAAAPGDAWYQKGFKVGKTTVPWVVVGGIGAGLVLLLAVAAGGKQPQPILPPLMF